MWVFVSCSFYGDDMTPLDLLDMYCTNISEVVTLSIFNFTYAKLAAVASSEELIPTKYTVQVADESDLGCWRFSGFRYKRLYS